MLKNGYLVVKIGVDTAENEPFMSLGRELRRLPGRPAAAERREARREARRELRRGARGSARGA